MHEDLKRNIERDAGRATIDFWEKIFTQASRSPWLMGRTQERNGCAFRSRCLAWLLKPANADALVSGIYSDAARPSLLAATQAFFRHWPPQQSDDGPASCP
ncbi:MAG: hypothetical protein LBS31_07485 [Candidatus Adiutrix sp.]|jgi:hypothetical protein|nr:hypothetical protein [Candidatus Adiutrix sp.]